MINCSECIHSYVCVDANRMKLMCCGGYQSRHNTVEVVRCKDCIRYKNDVASSKHSRGSCEFDNERKSRNHFCSYGERRSDG